MARLTLNLDCARFYRFALTYCTWVQGEVAGQPLDLMAEPWLLDLTNSILSRDDAGRRRYTEAFVSLAKGNIKSTWGALLALYFLVVESARSTDKGMQVFAAAASKEQAKVVFNNASRMVEASPLLGDYVTIHKNALYVPSTGASFQVLSSDAPKRHGLRPNVAIVDEIHAHESRELYDVLVTASVTRTEPLIVTLTNAGANSNGSHISAELYRRGKSGDDPRMFFHAPTVSDADLKVPETWVGKGSPNPASFITVERLLEQQLKMPPFTFQRFHLNRWTRAEKEWLLPGSWEECAGDDTLVPGENVIIGIDMARNHDSAALVIVAPRDGKFIAQCETWAAWADPSEPPPETHHVIEDDSIPFDAVFDRVRELLGVYNVLEVPYDPWRVPDAVSESLEAEGIPMVKFSQGIERMAPACQGLFTAVTEQQIVHGDDPKFTAQIKAATVKDYGQRGWKLDKDKTRDFMDASIALCEAVDRAREYTDTEPFVMRWVA